MHCEKQDRDPFFFLLQLAKYEITTVKVKVNGKASNFTEMRESLLERIQ